MSTVEESPYIARDPGDLITAEDWNDVQLKIQKDIDGRIDHAKAEIKTEGVDRATNAEHFANKSEGEFVDGLDERYAPKVHDHEGMSVYRRYIKEFTTDPGLNEVLLHHDLGRFPLVDVYELLPVLESAGKKDQDLRNCKLLFYYGHEDADKLNLWVKVGRERVPIGLPFEEVLREIGVKYEDDDTIEDVLNDLWQAFMADPNDEIKHCETPWVTECCGERRTVADLKQADQWDDLHLGIRPRKCVRGADLAEGVGCQLEVSHVNYKTLHIKCGDALLENSPVDLMFLLRA